MNKPKDCRSCPALRRSTGDCPLQSAARKYSSFEEQYAHCPLEDGEDAYERRKRT